MSLILEALRKSEAERRRGQVPGLHAELPPAPQPARPRRPAWPWLAALAVIAAGTAIWLGRDAWTPPAAVESASEPAGSTPKDPATVTAEPTGKGIGHDPPAEVDEAIPASSPAPVPTSAPAPAANVAAVAAPPVDSAPANSPGSTRAKPAPTESMAAQPRPAEAVASPPDGRDRAKPPSAATPPAASAPRSTPPAPTPTHSASPPAAPGSAPAAKAAPLGLSNLSATERRSLPTLKVSMHMWAPDPARRFAIIDGARVNEGDRLGDAVVDEITRDGVVLAWRGRRVHIPIY